MHIFYSGGENSGHYKKMEGAGAKSILLSYYYIQQKKIAPAVFDCPYPVKIMVDSGAHTLQQEEDLGKDYYEKYLNNYVEWLTLNKSKIFSAVELDIEEVVGLDTVLGWQEKYFRPLEKGGMKICYVWHKERGSKGWIDMCKNYKYVGLSDEKYSIGKQLGFLRIAKQSGALVHGFAMTKPEVLMKVPFYTVDSTRWLTGEQYGCTFIWGRNKMIELYKDNKDDRKRYKRYYRSIGVNYDKIADEDALELGIANIKAWMCCEDFVNKRTILKQYWSLPKPEADQPGTTPVPDAPAAAVEPQKNEPIAPLPQKPQETPKIAEIEKPITTKSLLDLAKESTIPLSAEQREKSITTRKANSLVLDPILCDNCLSGDTLITTNKGIVPIYQLRNKKFRVLSHDGTYQKARVIDKGIKNAILYTSQEGYTLKVTPEHKILVKHKWNKYPAWREVSRLRRSDYPVISPVGKFSEGDYNLGFLLGCIVGDGSLYKDKRGYWQLSFGESERYLDVILRVKRILEHRLHKKINLKCIEGSKYKQDFFHLSIRGQGFLQKLSDMGLTKDRLCVPETLLKEPSFSWDGFISGLFSCDGYVNSGRSFVGLYSCSRELLSQVQIMLSHYGIISNIYRQYKAGNLNRMKNSKELWVLSIKSCSIDRFKKIGIYAKNKQKELDKIDVKKKVRTSRKSATCNPLGEIEVYDISVDNTHSFVANGIVVHNCYAAEGCKHFKEGSLCALNDTFVNVGETRSPQEALDKIQEFIKITEVRANRMLHYEKIDGGYADKTTTALLDSLIDYNERLLRLQKEISKSHDTVTIQGNELLERIFGVMGDKRKEVDVIDQDVAKGAEEASTTETVGGK